jgi:hypothetical protein
MIKVNVLVLRYVRIIVPGTAWCVNLLFTHVTLSVQLVLWHFVHVYAALRWLRLRIIDFRTQHEFTCGELYCARTLLIRLRS